MNRVCARTLTAIVALGAVSTASTAAPLVYGQRNGGGGGAYFFGGGGLSHRIGDDFVLAGATSLTSFEFWAADLTGTHAFSGKTFDISIWADEGPGLGVDDAGLIAIESFSAASLAKTPLGSSTVLAGSFSSAISLAGGTTYWFSIGIDVETDFLWLTQGPSSPDPFGTPDVDFDTFSDGLWEGPFSTPSGAGLGFALYGDSGGPVIPLPSGVGLASVGLLGLAARRRRASTGR